MAGDDGFWVVLQEKAETIRWSLLLCFKVAELHTGETVCFHTAGIEEPPETYCSSSMKRQILHSRFELSADGVTF